MRVYPIALSFLDACQETPTTASASIDFGTFLILVCRFARCTLTQYLLFAIESILSRPSLLSFDFLYYHEKA